MAFNLLDIVGNIFHSDEKEKQAEEEKAANLLQRIGNALGINTTTAANKYNPFVKKNGELVNPNLNYQKLLDSKNISQTAKNYITAATGLSPTTYISKPTAITNFPKLQVYNGQVSKVNSPTPYGSKNLTTTPTPTTNTSTKTSGDNGEVKFNANANADKLGDMDIINELPKLSVKQIEAIISKHYKNSKVISTKDARAIYNAQNNSGISALVTLGIGGLESGWGTSNIANKTHNIWGYGATNDNPYGNAHKYASMEDAALQYSNSLKKTYYNGYGAKTINSIGTGNNPKGKGYAYNNDGSISTTWAPNVSSIMRTLYNTAKSAQ